MLFKRKSCTRPKCSSFTLMLIPGKYGSPKTLHFPRWLINFVLYFNITALIVIFIFIFNYKNLSKNYSNYLENNKELKTLNESQQQEITELKQSADEIKSKLEELRNLEEELKSKLNISSKGVGGPQVAYTSSADDLGTSIDTQIKSINDLLSSADKKIAFINSKPSILPNNGEITCYFGNRPNPFGGRGYEFHDGLDIASFHGAKIVASGDGVVEFSGWKSSYGNVIFINHGYGYVTIYAHNSKLLVKEGERVKRGQAIAEMGSTGRSTGTHVHFQINVNGTAVNPLKIVNGGE